MLRYSLRYRAGSAAYGRSDRRTYRGSRTARRAGAGGAAACGALRSADHRRRLCQLHDTAAWGVVRKARSRSDTARQHGSGYQHCGLAGGGEPGTQRREHSVAKARPRARRGRQARAGDPGRRTDSMAKWPAVALHLGNQRFASGRKLAQEQRGPQDPVTPADIMASYVSVIPAAHRRQAESWGLVGATAERIRVLLPVPKTSEPEPGELPGFDGAASVAMKSAFALASNWRGVKKTLLASEVLLVALVETAPQLADPMRPKPRCCGRCCMPPRPAQPMRTGATPHSRYPAISLARLPPRGTIGQRPARMATRSSRLRGGLQFHFHAARSSRFAILSRHWSATSTAPCGPVWQATGWMSPVCAGRTRQRSDRHYSQPSSER